MTIFRVRTALYSRRGDRLRTVAIHLLALVTLSTASFDTQAQSAGSIRRIGYVRSGTADIDPYRTSFVRGMRELGYFEGRNVAYEFRYYGDHAGATLSGIINDLVHAKVEIIVIGGSAAIRSAQGITRTIPIVMSAAADPLASGLVESLARPGGNTTGVAFMSAELTVKRLELLKEILPETTRVGVLRNPDNPAHLSIMTSAELATVPLGLTLRSFDVRGSDQLESNFAEMKSWPADAVVVLDDSVFISERAAIAAQAKSKRLAMICGIRELIEGCLLSYAANIGDMYFRSASYVDRILKGAKPGDLPVQQPVTFDLLINLKIAKAFGLTVPPSLLARANEVIE
jgi:putative ABC transport system substrate-binding protein